jgi:hypothetical protein
MKILGLALILSAFLFAAIGVGPITSFTHFKYPEDVIYDSQIVSELIESNPEMRSQIAEDRKRMYKHYIRTKETNLLAGFACMLAATMHFFGGLYILKKAREAREGTQSI